MIMDFLFGWYCDPYDYGWVCSAYDWIFFILMSIVILGVAFFLLSMISLAVYEIFFKEYLTEGTVIGKFKEPEESWVQFIPMMAGKVMIMIPIFHHDDEDWVITVRKEGKTGNIYLPKKVWERVDIGEYYVSSENDSFEDDVEERDATDQEIEEYQ